MALHGNDRGREVSLGAVLAEIGKGKTFPCYLLCGDEEFRIEDALMRIIAALIPAAADRDFSLFTIDGEHEDPDSLCEMLSMAPLLAGPKVIVVRNTRLFQSRHTLTSLIARIKEHLERDPARVVSEFRRFLQLTELAFQDLREGGWKRIDDEQWRKICPDAAEGIADWLPKALEICEGEGRNWGVVKERPEEADRLERLLSGGDGMPERHHLVLTTESPDRRKRLYKTIIARGRVLAFPRGKEAARQHGVQELAAERLQQRGKRLSAAAWSVLGRKTGFELRESMGAIEKLILYAGERCQIEAQDVEAVIGRTKEDTVFDLTGALATRNLSLALGTLQELLGQGLHPLMVLTMISREIRFLYQAKLLLSSGGLTGFHAGMDYGGFQKRILPQVKAPVAAGQEPPAIASQHPYVVYQALKNAAGFSEEELVALLECLLATDLALKSTDRNPRFLLERILVTACGAGSNPVSWA